MECTIYINNEQIGKTIFHIVDETMGAINGHLIVNEKYKKFQKIIQKQTEENGISNTSNFNYKIITDNNVEVIAEGGIGITDSEEFKEIIIEAAGVSLTNFF